MLINVKNCLLIYRANIFCLLLMLNSCVDPFYIGGKVILPTGWPIPGLVVPASATRAPLFMRSQDHLEYTTSNELLQQGTRYEAQLWAVGFHTEDSYSNVATHIYQCLPADQYAVSYSGTFNSYWISKDGFTEVRLNCKPNSGIYELEIHVYKHPHKPAHM
jgi:hypothetical protein